MAATKDQLLSRLQELHVDFARYDHPVVMTVEAQEKYVGHLGGGLSKNLFLKDKKRRYYIISALTKTNVDLKVLSQRLGLGKGGIRMAPEEDLQNLLKVPLGCVTPFALINESARSVSLLLDHGFKTQKCCLFHPLANDTTISLSSSDLDKFLLSIGRSPSYVDLEATPLVGKDLPPDLAALVPSEAPAIIELPEKLVPVQTSAESHTRVVNKPASSATLGSSDHDKFLLSIGRSPDNMGIEADSSSQRVQGKQVSKKPSSVATSQGTVADVGKLLDEMIEKIAATVISEVERHSLQDKRELLVPIVAEVRKRIGADLENLTMSLKNASYTEGFHSGIQSVLHRGLQSPSSRGIYTMVERM